MAVRQDATLNLSNLIKGDLSTGGETSGAGLLAPKPELLEADGLTLEAPLAWELTVRATGGDDFLVTGEVSGTAVLQCRRCLTDVPTESESSFIYPMAYRPSSKGLDLVETEEGEEDLLVFGQPEVDFAPLLAQIYAIDLPLTVLCKESCKGLSPEGVNLNEHPEAAPGPESEAGEKAEESPFSVLKDLDL
ncbi:MAG TPA: DUF177 domain-containing protein [Trueperaceae bacterium]